MAHKQLILLVVSITALAALTAVLYAQDADEAPAAVATVKAVGLSVAMHDGSDNDSGSFAQSLDAGTIVHLLVDFGDEIAIEVLDDDSTIEAFTDDVGTVLLEPGEAERFGFKGMRNAEIGETGHTARFYVTTNKRPAAEAKAVVLQATVVFVLGRDETTAKLDSVALKPGEKLTAGDHILEVKSVGKPSWGDAQLEVEFSSRQSFGGIKAMRFFDADGKEIESEVNGNSRMQANDYVVFGRTLWLMKAVDVATIEIDYYAETERVPVAVDVTAGVGL